jgi:hypothetical protein
LKSWIAPTAFSGAGMRCLSYRNRKLGVATVEHMCYSNGARFSASVAPHQRRRGPQVPVPLLSSLFPSEPPAPTPAARTPFRSIVNGNSVDLRNCVLNPGEVRFVELDVLFDLIGDGDFAADFVRSDALPIFQRQVHQ